MTDLIVNTILIVGNAPLVGLWIYGSTGDRRYNPQWWGFTHPFGKPHFWWSLERTREYYKANGIPWRQA